MNFICQREYQIPRGLTSFDSGSRSEVRAYGQENYEEDCFLTFGYRFWFLLSNPMYGDMFRHPPKSNLGSVAMKWIRGDFSNAWQGKSKKKKRSYLKL